MQNFAAKHVFLETFENRFQFFEKYYELLAKNTGKPMDQSNLIFSCRKSVLFSQKVALSVESSNQSVKATLTLIFNCIVS